MCKILLFISCIFLTSLSFAQTPDSISHIELTETINKETKTLRINISDYSLENMESFKEELISWKEKISSVDIKEENNELIVTHFLTLDNRELYDVFKRYNIDKNSIISYK